MLKPDYYTIKDFQFQSGESLPELNIEYATLGEKKLDDEGNITNAILYLHGYAGDYAFIENLGDIFGSRKAIDTDKFFIICPTALGSPGSSAPSTSGLKTKFPEYTIRDLVNAQKTLITEKFEIKHLKGVIGSSMGGFQTLRWAVDYPDFMDFIIPIATSYEFRGQIHGVYSQMNNIIKGDPDYKNGDYEEQPKRAMEITVILNHLFSFSPEYFKYEFESNEQLIKSFDDRTAEIANIDANDVVWRNRAILSFNIKSDLSKIRTKTLIIGIRQDQIFPPETDVIPLGEMIEGSEMFLYDSILGHYGCVGDIKKSQKPIKDFLDK